MNLRSSKLHDRSEDHGLPVLERTRRDRRRPGVGAIIGADVPGIEECEYCANSKDIIILLKNHLDGWQKAATRWLVLSGRVLEGFWRAAGIKRKLTGLCLYMCQPQYGPGHDSPCAIDAVVQRSSMPSCQGPPRRQETLRHPCTRQDGPPPTNPAIAYENVSTLYRKLQTTCPYPR